MMTEPEPTLEWIVSCLWPARLESLGFVHQPGLFAYWFFLKPGCYLTARAEVVNTSRPGSEDMVHFDYHKRDFKDRVLPLAAPSAFVWTPPWCAYRLAVRLIRLMEEALLDQSTMLDAVSAVESECLR